MITLKQLRYFAALARHRHFGRAAEACAVSQPALSMQIRDMEARLGVDLVERRPGDVTLTPVGLDVAGRAERVLAATRDIMDVARHHGRPLGGRLGLGVIPTLAPYVLPAVLPVLQQRCPDLRIELRETQTRVLLEELVRGDLDVAMVALPVEPPEVETLRLFVDPFVLAVPAVDPRPAAFPIDPRTIERDRLILLEEGHCLRDQALAVCSGTRNDTLGLGATSLSTVVQLVAGGYGATLLPQVAAVVEGRNPNIKLLRFIPPEPGRTVGLAFRRTSPRKEEFVVLATLMREALGVTQTPVPLPRVSVRRAAARANVA